MDEAEVAREWQVWAAANLLRGATPGKVHERLVAEGVPDEMASELIEELRASPVLEAGVPLVRAARRFEAFAEESAARQSWAAQPTEVVRERATSPERFYDVWVAAGQPVLLSGLVERAFDLEAWSPAALAQRFGDVEIELTCERDHTEGYEERFLRKVTTMPLASFVERMERSRELADSDVYVVAENRNLLRTRLRELLDDVRFPDGWVDDEAMRAPKGAALWLGPAGTTTTLHHDQRDVLLCQLHGTKRWRLVSPTNPTLVARSARPMTTLTPDDLSGALIKEVIVEPGDALYVPAGWWHHVYALEPSCSVSIVAMRRSDS